MNTSPPIVFIDDAHTFGGAQIAMGWGIRSIICNTSERVVCVCTEKTRRAVEEIVGLTPRLEFIECPPALPLNIFSFPLRIPAFFRILRPLLRLGVRGWWLNLSGIEFCLAPLTTLLWFGEKPHGWLHNTERFAVLIKNASWRRALLSRLRDWSADRWAFSLYPSIITPSQSTIPDVEARLRGKRRPFIGHLYSPPIGEQTRVVRDIERDASISGHRVIDLWMIGRIDYGHKNNLIALDVLGRLEENSVNATLTIVGDGPDFADMKIKAQALSFGRKVIFLGWSNTPWDTISQSATVLIPSFYESMCIVAREAMVRGIRIVASPIPVFHEWIPDSLIANDFAVDTFVEKIVEVQGLPTRQLLELYDAALLRFSDKTFIESFKKYSSQGGSDGN
ncbi:glycosyltransferase [Granulicella pectinivorans]|nr:glycosyltransferase [Granulicella pectinivorans]